VSRRSPLSTLRPFLSTDGLIRIGGRLALSSMDYAEKHPIVLAKDSHLSLLLIQEAHALALHGGPQLTRSVLSRFYWIVQANTLIRSEIKQCVQCERRKEPQHNSRCVTCHKLEYVRLNHSGHQE